MLEGKNISIKIGTRYLIEGLSFTLNKGDKLAIIGEEGNGKSTLLKSILGLCDYAEMEGTILFHGNRVGYLAQSLEEEYREMKVRDFLFFDETDYYEKVGICYTLLETFSLEDSLFEQTMASLSGGEKVKIRILKLLLEDDDVLCLDEPTNDLDLETLKWLEHFIKTTSKPVLYVSHDETLLSHTANRVLHLEQIKHKTECRYTLLNVGYDEYVLSRLRSIAKQNQMASFEKRAYDKKQEKLQQVMQKVEHQQNTITRADPHGGKMLKKKMHSLKSQEKRLEETERTNPADVEEEIFFCFEDGKLPSRKKVLSYHLEELTVENKILAKHITLEMIGNMHLCIIGKNGQGKSTLLKKIYHELRERDDLKVGYMPQNYDDVLNQYEFVFDFLAPSNTKEELTKARMYLGNMKFTKEEMTGKIKDLSNGTKAKLFLIKLVLEKCNVLILDEPTRNVSPLSNPVIRSVLKEFQGAIISVSHDRLFLKEVIDHIYRLSEEGLKRCQKETIC